jgi:hypothetical protein
MSQAEPNLPDDLPNDQPRDLPPELPPDVRRRIDGHLDAIEQVLFAAGVSRCERRGVVDEVETQIFEMLAARSGEEPGEAVAAVLSQLDPPSAYAPEAAAAPAATARSASPVRALWQRWQGWWSPPSDAPRLSRPALVAAAWFGMAALFALVVFADHRPPDAAIALFFLVGLTAPIGVTALGFWSVRRIRRSAGRETGLPLALVETFIFPIVLANLALIGLLAATDGAGLIILAVLVIVGANVGLARYAWRRFGGRFLARVDSY